jgi:hypothetical protein
MCNLLNKKGLKLLPVKPFLFYTVIPFGLFSNLFIEDLKKLVDVCHPMVQISNLFVQDLRFLAM